MTISPNPFNLDAVNAKETETPNDAPSFEQALAQLEQIIARLEEGQAGLSESLAADEEGIRLQRQCHELLGDAERKVEVLAGFDAAGNPVKQPLEDVEGESLEEKSAARSRRRSAPAPTPHSPRRPKPLAGRDIDADDIPY